MATVSTTSQAPDVAVGKWLKRLFFGVLLIGILWSLTLLSDKYAEVSPMAHWFPLKQIIVRGELRKASKSHIKALITADEQQDLLQIDINVMQEDIEKLPWVRYVSVRKVWPDALIIDVEPHRAVARWNEQQWLNSHGEIFNGLEVNESFNHAIVLSGPLGTNQEVLNTLHDINAILKPLDLSLSRLELNERGAWKMMLTNGLRVYAGEKNLPQRLRKLVVLYAQIVRDMKSPLDYMDLRYDTGIAVKPRYVK